MKNTIIYHDNCADGFGAAFAAWKYFGDDAEYIPCHYGAQQAQVIKALVDAGNMDDRNIYILDFSFSLKQMRLLLERANTLTWLDHHTTSRPVANDLSDTDWKGPRLEALTDRLHIVHDNDKSGALLAWEHFHSNVEAPMLFRHLDDYDRWQFKLEGSKAINGAIRSYAPWTLEQWATWTRYHDCPPLLYSEGAAILRAREQDVAAVVAGATRPCSITCVVRDGDDGYKATIYVGLAANCPPHLASDVGHELANRSGTYGLLWYINKDGKCLCSLRSNGDYDVSAIAKVYDGGGHKNAAGFEVLPSLIFAWIGVRP